MPDTAYYNPTNGYLYYNEVGNLSLATVYYSINGGAWTKSSNGNYYINLYDSLGIDDMTVRLKYGNTVGAYHEIMIPGYSEFSAKGFSVDISNETISGLDSTKTYSYRIGDGNYIAIPSGSTSFSITTLMKTSEQTLYLREGTTGVPVYTVLPARNAAPTGFTIEFPSSGTAVIATTSDYEYSYNNVLNFNDCTNEGIMVEWTHDPNTYGSRKVYIRLKATDTEPASDAYLVSVARMIDAVSYDTARGIIQLGTSLSSTLYSVNDSDWISAGTATVTEVAINKFLLSSSQENTIRIKKGIDCTYTEIVVPAITETVSGLFELTYIDSPVGESISAFRPATGTIKATTDVGYFRFEVDSTRTNACLTVVDNQALVNLTIKIFDSNGKEIPLGSMLSYSNSSRSFALPADLPEGTYYGYVLVADAHRGWVATNYSVIYTEAEYATTFEAGSLGITNLARHDANAGAAYAIGVLEDSRTEHWYRVYMSTNTGFIRNCITLTSTYLRADFTIRHTSNPEVALYDSSADPTALRTRFKGFCDIVLKVDWQPPSDGYYYIVVKAVRNIYQEPYSLQHGDPTILSASETITGSIIPVSVKETFVTTNIDVVASATIPTTAKVRYISVQSFASSGHAEIQVKKNSEVSWHTGDLVWTYIYATQWNHRNMVDVAGRWNYRLKLPSHATVPMHIQPKFTVNFYYELGD